MKRAGIITTKFPECKQHARGLHTCSWVNLVMHFPPQEEYVAIPVSQIWRLRPREVNLAKIHNNLVNSRVHICFPVFPSVPSFFVFKFLFVLKYT